MSPAFSVGTITISTSISGAALFVSVTERMAARALELDVPRDADEAIDGAFHGRLHKLTDVALAAVLTSSMSVEAALNELFLAHELGTAAQQGIDPIMAKRLSEVWNAGAHKLSVIEKADAALAISDKPPLDWGSRFPQRLKCLLELRNALVHHKPEAFPHGVDAHESTDKLRRKLAGHFEDAIMCKDSGVPYRWSGCLGSGCATWSSETARSFNQEIYAAIGGTFLF